MEGRGGRWSGVEGGGGRWRGVEGLSTHFDAYNYIILGDISREVKK